MEGFSTVRGSARQNPRPEAEVVSVALFDPAFKDEVRAKNDIAEVISSYVKLERRGNRFVGLCPFHGEKTLFPRDPRHADLSLLRL